MPKAIRKLIPPGSPPPSRSRTSGSPIARQDADRGDPTCTVEMTPTGSSIRRSTAAARQLPASARPASTARRAVTTAYSPTTKKAFAPTRARTATTRSRSSTPGKLAAGGSIRRGSGLDQAALVGDHDELGAVAGAELEQDAADVGLGGGGADDQPFGDLLVAEAGGDQGQHLAFALGQLFELGRRVTVVAGLGDELGDQLAGD